MNNELYDLVQSAQLGDSEAMQEIIGMFRPAIRSAKSKLKSDYRDDLEQILVEIMMKKIMSYNLELCPDYTSFCRELYMNESKLAAI
jgi:hypothetical protein